MFMQASETILLLMPDAARRADCFAVLANRPQRIVRGFGDSADVREAIDTVDQACLMIDQAAIRQPGFRALTAWLEERPAIVALAIAPALNADDAMTLLACPRCEIVRSDDVTQAAARAEALLPAIAALGARWRAEQAARTALARLSPREATVLAGLAGGQTSKDIARTLGVSPRTIEVHRASIMRRTGTNTLAELLRLHFLAELPVAPMLARAA